MEYLQKYGMYYYNACISYYIFGVIIAFVINWYGVCEWW